MTCPKTEPENTWLFNLLEDKGDKECPLIKEWNVVESAYGMEKETLKYHKCILLTSFTHLVIIMGRRQLIQYDPYQKKQCTMEVTMKRIHLFILIILITTAAFGQKPDGLTDKPEHAAQQSFIFVFNDTVRSAEVKGLARAMAVRNGGQLEHVYETALKGFSAKLPLQAAENLSRNNPQIAYFTANGVAYGMGTPVATRASGQAKPGGGPPPQETPYGITRVGGGVTTSNATAWVIDSGIDLDHPDLNVDVARSISYISYGGGSNQSPDDYNGHGTHVAGIIAAIDNNDYTVGVTPGTTVVSVRVLGRNNSGSWADIIAGIDHVAANAAPGDVANISIGGSYNQAVNDAIIAASATCPFTISAGNDGEFTGDVSPASAEGPNLYSVSAININDELASWSNWGIPPVDWAEPGVSVLSLYKGAGTATYNGTSMAAPHLAGLLLLGNVVNGGSTVNTDPNGDAHPIGVH